MEADAAFVHGGFGGGGQGARVHEPLFRDQWLDHRVVARAMPHGMDVRFGALQEPLALQELQVGRSGLKSFLAGPASGVVIQGAVAVHDVDDGQVMAFAHCRVVGIVARRDLDCSGPERRIHE